MIDLQVQQVYHSYFDGLVLNDINLSIKAGEMVGLLGPNGSGKTTLVKLIAGVLKPNKGKIMLNNTDLNRMNRMDIARNLAVVPQYFNSPFAFYSTDVVMLGRTPFINMFSGESAIDKQSVSEVIDMTGIKHLKNRRFDELSGGERQKVILAMALAQNPKMLLLDEPTVHLDINHQVEILELIKRLNLEQRLTIIATMHDFNLASLYFDRLILLKDGKVLVDGTPAQVLTKDRIQKTFSVTVKVEPHSVTGVPQIVIIPSGSNVKKQ
ncbi:MAG: ABC transporter ATP-binding protein [Dehalococcoidales bacterium]|nr:ABC transporter ATP-binding protein [Dehalococcoidales bacterium]